MKYLYIFLLILLSNNSVFAQDCVNDTITVFAPPFNNTPPHSIEICLGEVCDLGMDYTISNVAYTFSPVTLLPPYCFEYSPLPGQLGIDTRTVTVCNDSGECGEVIVELFVGVPTSIQAPKKQVNLQVYPNPASDQVYFTIPDMAAQSTEFTAILYDFSGKMVREATFAHHLATPYQLDVSGLSEGIYFLKIRGASGESSENGQAYRVLVGR